jgi:phosphatidylglycerophosphatase A
MAQPTESPNLNNEDQGPPRSDQPTVGFFPKAFASGLFSGYSPIASGTVGSAVGLAIYWIPGFENPVLMAAVCVLVFALGVRTSGEMEKVYGHDPSEVTIDEVLGMWISLILLPKSILISAVGFFMFRILDIFKPYPAGLFDKLHGGKAIMLDDVISALYTNLLLQAAVAIHIL